MIANEIDRLAAVSVWRGTGFAALAIAAAMSSLVFDPALAMRLGGVLTLLLAIALRIKASLIQRKPAQETEVWVLLDRDRRPHRDVAAQLIRAAMREKLHEVSGLVTIAALALFGTYLVLWATA